MKRINYILMAFLWISISACSRKIVSVQSEVVHDTLTVTKTIVERDTIIQVPGSSIAYQLPIPIPKMFTGVEGAKNGIIAKQEKQASLKITYSDHQIRIDCGCDTVQLKAKLFDTFQKEARKTVVEKTIVHQQRFVPKWVKVLAWSGSIFYLLLLIGLLRKFNVL